MVDRSGGRKKSNSPLCGLQRPDHTRWRRRRSAVWRRRGRRMSAALSFNLIGALSEVTNRGALSEVTNRTLMVNDPLLGPVRRSYILHTPLMTLRKGEAAPLILGFHGQGHLAGDWAKQHTFNELADEDGWHVAYPQGMADGGTGDFDSGWNVGTNADDSTCLAGTTGTGCHTSCAKLGQCGRCAWSSCYSDIAFVQQLLTALASELAFDTSRVYAVGESNGAMVCPAVSSQRPSSALLCPGSCQPVRYRVAADSLSTTWRHASLARSLLSHPSSGHPFSATRQVASSSSSAVRRRRGALRFYRCTTEPTTPSRGKEVTRPMAGCTSRSSARSARGPPCMAAHSYRLWRRATTTLPPT